MIALDLFAGTGWGVACQRLGIEEYGVEIMPEVPVDGRVVALVRLPVGVTALYEISMALDKHLGPDLVIRTDTGIAGWCVISKPEPGDPS